MKKLLFIMNPYAGMRRANRYVAEIIELFNRAGYEVTVYMTAGPGDGMRVVAEKAGDVDRIVCCGGDGTLNETVSGMLQSGADVPIGYIPAGSTNDLAASLGLNMDIMKAARVCVEGQETRYDVGSFGDRYFTYVASFGAFTRASYATPQNVKNALGHTAYVLEGIQELSQIRNEHLRLELDDGTVLEDDFIFGAVSNSTSVGGILTLDPRQVDMCDGKLELLLVRSPKDLGELAECLMALQKQTYNCAMMTFLSAKSLRVYARGDMPWTLDGERQDGTECVDIHCLHRGIRILK